MGQADTVARWERGLQRQGTGAQVPAPVGGSLCSGGNWYKGPAVSDVTVHGGRVLRDRGLCHIMHPCSLVLMVVSPREVGLPLGSLRRALLLSLIVLFRFKAIGDQPLHFILAGLDTSRSRNPLCLRDQVLVGATIIDRQFHADRNASL